MKPLPVSRRLAVQNLRRPRPAHEAGRDLAHVVLPQPIQGPQERGFSAITFVEGQPGEPYSVAQGSLDLPEGHLPLGAIDHVVGYPRRPAPRAIRIPGMLRQEQFAVQQRVEVAGRIPQMNADHAVVHLASGSTMLPLDAGGLGALLGKARLVDQAHHRRVSRDEHPALGALLGDKIHRRRFRQVPLECVHRLVHERDTIREMRLDGGTCAKDGNLVVLDDEPEMVKALTRLLRAKYFDVRGFVSVDAFLKAYVPQECACLVLDVAMPELDGLELQRRLSEQAIPLPIIFLTGHGNMTFSDLERQRLRTYLENGGFIYADDDYGMDKAFRRELRKIFPDQSLVELPFSHGIYHCVYDFPYGPPKTHEHDKKEPQGFGLFHGTRLTGDGSKTTVRMWPGSSSFNLRRILATWESTTRPPA